MLAEQHCEPCEKGTPPMPAAEARTMHMQIPEWQLEPKRLVRTWRLKDFRQALALANAVGRLAEEQGHHPDLHLTDYRNLRIELTTHAIGGLSRNDFVLAAKIDRLPEAATPTAVTPSAKASQPRTARKA